MASSSLNAVQGTLFSAAVHHKASALDFIEEFQLPEARNEIRLALEIDPYLADLKTLLAGIELLIDAAASDISPVPELAML